MPPPGFAHQATTDTPGRYSRPSIDSRPPRRSRNHGRVTTASPQARGQQEPGQEPGREPGQDQDWTPDPRRWRAFAVCLVAGFMSLLDVSIVNVALPSIQQSLHASSSELQWVVSGYALAFGLVLVPSGRLG